MSDAEHQGHARNHAAFRDEYSQSLTPAYDIARGNKFGEAAVQAMAYRRDGSNASNFAKLIEHAIRSDFDEGAGLGRLSRKDRQFMFARQFLDPSTLHGYRPVQV